jgi:hypothetical protein
MHTTSAAAAAAAAAASSSRESVLLIAGFTCPISLHLADSEMLFGND